MIKLTLIIHNDFYKFGNKKACKKNKGRKVSIYINPQHILFIYDGVDETILILTDGHISVQETQKKIVEQIENVIEIKEIE